MKTERGRSFTLNKLYEKEMKNLEILELIRGRGVISRADISKITGINLVSIYNYTKDYIDNKILSEKGFDVSTGGRKPELVELNIKDNYIIGLEITPTMIRGAVVDLAPKIIKKKSMSLDTKDTAGALTEILSDLCGTSGSSPDNIRAIGVGVSDIDPTGIESIIRGFNTNFFIGNSASCAAAGEKYLNPNANLDNILYVFSSLGRGVVLKKEEMFEESYSEDAKYLRPWNNSLGIIGLTNQEISRGIGTMIVDLVKANLAHITEDTVVEAANAKDEIALGIIQGVAASLGIRISYLVNLFSPAVVIIGGGLEKSGELMLGGIRKAVDKLALRKLAGTVKIIPAVLGEDAVSVGAASLAVREIFLRI